MSSVIDSIDLVRDSTLQTTNAILSTLASNNGGLVVKGWDNVKQFNRLGLAPKVFAVGDQFEVEREKSLTVGVGDSTGITGATVNEAKFVQAVGEAHTGIYEFSFDGAVWRNENGDVINLTTYGITVTGTAVSGDHIVVNETADKLVYDILDFNKHTPVNSHHDKSICIGMHNLFTYGTMPFCAPQLMYWTENGLPAGKYRFTLDHAVYGGGTQYDGTYMFTLTQPIPADGGFRHTNPVGGWKNSYAKSDVIGNYITVYGARPARAEGERNVAVAEWDNSECTDLGVFTARARSYYSEDDEANGGKRNFTERQAYGSNRWRDSVYRQWLNSNAPAVPSNDSSTVSNWWRPKTVFDRVPGGAKWAGFLYGLDPSFVEAMGEVEVKTALCDTDKVGDVTYDITHDKVWLQSMTEIWGTANNGVMEGSQLAYWKNTTDADRIKYEGTTARYWWLRSPNPTYAYFVRYVHPSGTLNYNYAYNANGVVPACCIT